MKIYYREVGVLSEVVGSVIIACERADDEKVFLFQVFYSHHDLSMVVKNHSVNFLSCAAAVSDSSASLSLSKRR